MLTVSAMPAAGEPADDVAEVLDALHAAAANSDGEAYFALYAEDAVFFGTDPGERWSVDGFKGYALPLFNAGTGWVYHPTERNIFFSDDGTIAWFDEVVVRDAGGDFRGTGVLRREGDAWLIVQYNLSLPFQNELWDEIIALVEKQAELVN